MTVELDRFTLNEYLPIRFHDRTVDPTTDNAAALGRLSPAPAKLAE